MVCPVSCPAFLCEPPGFFVLVLRGISFQQFPVLTDHRVFESGTFHLVAAYHVRLHLIGERLAFLAGMPCVSLTAELLVGFVLAAKPAVMPLLFLLFCHAYCCFNNSEPFSVRRYFCFGWLGCSGYNGIIYPSFNAGCK